MEYKKQERTLSILFRALHGEELKACKIIFGSLPIALGNEKKSPLTIIAQTVPMYPTD